MLDVPAHKGGEDCVFENGTCVVGQQRGFADVFKRSHFAWEYKAPGKPLDAALRQHMMYALVLRTAYADSVPGGVDLVCYWFDKALKAIRNAGLGAAGLVATQSVRRGANRTVLDSIVRESRLFDAWADKPWVNDGAAARVSMVCFGAANGNPRMSGIEVPRITADLGGCDDRDLTTAQPLRENAELAFEGPVEAGAFDFPESIARNWFTQFNPNGRSNAEVLKPWANGQDVAGRACDKWIVDFGATVSEQGSALFSDPFACVRAAVKPQRAAQSDASRKLHWCRHGRTGEDFRAASTSFRRYFAIRRVAKHRFFVWLRVQVWPNSQRYGITRADEFGFGVLSSRIHEMWSLANASMHGVGNARHTTRSLAVKPLRSPRHPTNKLRPSPASPSTSATFESAGSTRRSGRDASPRWCGWAWPMRRIPAASCPSTAFRRNSRSAR